MNSHNWYGILSTLTTELNDRFKLIAGFDGRYYKGIHYRRLENLLGNDVYYSQSDVNGDRYISEESPAKFGNFSDNSYKDKTNVLAYWNDGFTGQGVDVAVIDTGVVPVPGLDEPGKVINGPDLSFESQSPDHHYLDLVAANVGANVDPEAVARFVERLRSGD